MEIEKLQRRTILQDVIARLRKSEESLTQIGEASLARQITPVRMRIEAMFTAVGGLDIDSGYKYSSDVLDLRGLRGKR